MLTPETKRHIDAARQVLVGKVPDPKSQIEQITNALVYKFMDDMDEQSAVIGGKRRYFVGDYEKYGWQRLMNEGLGAHDRLILYREALESMSKNPNLPELFQSIFRNAYLPFNDARTLSLFLKEVDFFSYANSEELGNGYEYLLSIMGSQGDAGQFRTPRHIIDFIVAVINPTKNDSVLDPACGTAGFLISAYKHVMSQHDSKDNISGVFEQNELPLTADEKKKLYHSYRGFDIDDNMVKMAKVNMYLHSFPDPNIIVHDSLSSEDYWNNRYDVILANPPFMSPKGGIVPHKKFGIEANRAEVLFVDYIASHLKPTGRAGVIVPEGIIFQSGKAYKELRKNLVDNYLYAVVSLPAGVFQPYSGVKTSILFLDKDLASKCDNILFVKIENDGFSIGAQRREVRGNQLPETIKVIKSFQQGKEFSSTLIRAITRKQIAESVDYTLSGGRYELTSVREAAEFPMANVGDVATVDNGNAFKSSEYVDSGARIIRITNVQKGKVVDDGPKYIAVERLKLFSKYELFANDLLMSLTGNVGRVGLIKYEMLPALLNQRVARVNTDQTKILKEYLFYILNRDEFEDEAIANASGIAQKNLSTEWLKKYRFPLPPIEVQREIATQLDSYQKILDAAQTIVKAYKPTIKINPAWKEVNLPEVVEINKRSEDPVTAFGGEDNFTYIDVSAVGNGNGVIDLSNKIPTLDAPSRARRIIKKDDVLLSTVRPNLKAFALVKVLPGKVLASTGFAVLTPKPSILPEYLYFAICRDEYVDQLVSVMGKGSYPSVNTNDLIKTKILLPPLEEQKEIVESLEAEQQLIAANKTLTDLYTQKVRQKIAEVWGE